MQRLIIYFFHNKILIMNLTWLIQNQDIKRARREEKEEKNILQSTDFLYDILFPRSLVRIFMTGFMRFSLTFSANFVAGAQRTQKKPKRNIYSFYNWSQFVYMPIFGELLKLFCFTAISTSLSSCLSLSTLSFVCPAWHSTLVELVFASNNRFEMSRTQIIFYAAYK